MDLRRLRTGEWLAAISGAALFVSLFLPWYEIAWPRGPARSGWTAYGPLDGSLTASGWESLSVIDVLLVLVAASGVLLAVVTATQRVPAVPVALSALMSIFGTLGVVLVLFRVLDLPDWAAGRDWGVWLGLASTLGVVAGALLAMRDEIRP
jgi:heme/copper-type cytochrome/quinol oxidase subunit 1